MATCSMELLIKTDDKMEEEILEIINKATNSEYKGNYKIVRDDDDSSWDLFLYLNQEMSPMVLSYQGDFEGFKKFIYEDLRARRLQLTQYWKAQKIYDDFNVEGDTFNYKDLML